MAHNFYHSMKRRYRRLVQIQIESYLNPPYESYQSFGKRATTSTLLKAIFRMRSDARRGHYGHEDTLF